MFEHQVYAPTTGTNGFMPLDTDEHEEETGGNYYYIDLGTVVNQMKRYSCTCLSGQNCKTHSKAEASQKILVPLRRTNGLTSIRSSKVQIDDEKAKVEGETQKKKELEKENFRKWLLEKAKQKEDQAKREKEKLLRKKREAEEKKKLRKAEGELRYKLWLKEKERENLGEFFNFSVASMNSFYFSSKKAKFASSFKF